MHWKIIVCAKSAYSTYTCIWTFIPPKGENGRKGPMKDIDNLQFKLFLITDKDELVCTLVDICSFEI